jgi:hypothetical protein
MSSTLLRSTQHPFGNGDDEAVHLLSAVASASASTMIRRARVICVLSGLLEKGAGRLEWGLEAL